ncbi:MAG: hypothetical protein KAR14_00640, partial [Candidatus Aminicenantes bacterium]|nr:hypothetical protein [Candidatus Aminicenantes bacterium]
MITDPLFIYDIAPIILHLAGIEPLMDMDGNIVQGILNSDNVRRKKVRSSGIKKKFVGVDDFN